MIKKLFNYYEDNCVLCIMFFIFGILNLLINYFFCRLFNLGNMIIAFIPFIVSVLFLFLLCKKDIKNWIKECINGLIVTLGIILLIVNFGGLIINETFEQNTDVKSYSRVRRICGNSKQMEHFPKRIPKTAEEVEFLEWAPFMQGGSGIYLSYNIDEETTQKIDDEYKDKSMYVLNNMQEVIITGQNIDMLSRIKDEISYNEILNISDEFTLYILGAEKFSGEGYWNHGVEYGIIINKTKERVTYFHEKW